MGNVSPFVLSDANSWLVRVYVYWLKVTGSRIPWQENFCHFCRVVLFWAPIEWLFMTKRGWRGIFRPYELFALLPLAGWLWFLTLAVEEGNGLFWKMALSVTCGLLGIFAVCASFMEELDARKEPTSYRAAMLTSALWGWFVAAILIIFIVGDALLKWAGPLVVHAYNALPKPQQKPESRSETREFFTRVLGQFHETICPPVQFNVDLRAILDEGM